MSVMINTSGRSRSAFTLIEVLVVVAIIALLVAILLPSLARAREQAKRAACASNLHQQGLAMYSYSNDYRGFLPWRGWFSYDISESKHEAYGGSGTQKVLVNLALLIGKHVGKDWDVLYCPCTIDTYKNTASGLPSLWDASYTFTSGGYNYALPMAKRTGSPKLDLDVYPRDPDKLDGKWLAALAEGAPPEAVDTSGNVNLVRMMPRRPQVLVMDFVIGGGKTLHPGGINALFSDGHCKFVKYSELPASGGGVGSSGSMSSFELWQYATARP